MMFVHNQNLLSLFMPALAWATLAMRSLISLAVSVMIDPRYLAAGTCMISVPLMNLDLPSAFEPSEGTFHERDTDTSQGFDFDRDILAELASGV
jgi:hypothetical protein